MSRVSDTRIRTRQAAAELVASGRVSHELTVDLIYAEIRQGSRTTINDELKLWKDEQARVDALSAALPPSVSSAMLSVWALAVEEGEKVFAQRGEELETEATAASTRASELEEANAALQADVRILRTQLDDYQAKLAASLIEAAQAQTGRDSALRQAEAVGAERDAVRRRLEQSLHDMQSAHARELETLRTIQAEHEAILRTEISNATSRLEAVQKHVMLQSEEAREAQRRTEAELASARQRTEQLIIDVQRVSADAAEHRRLAALHERQSDNAEHEARDLRLERDTLARELALLEGQLKARAETPAARRTRRSRQNPR